MVDVFIILIFFFCAPYQKSTIDYSTIDTEKNSSFPGLSPDMSKGRTWIRVDPDYTNVYHQDICDTYGDYPNIIERKLAQSRKTMTVNFIFVIYKKFFL